MGARHGLVGDYFVSFSDLIVNCEMQIGEGGEKELEKLFVPFKCRWDSMGGVVDVVGCVEFVHHGDIVLVLDFLNCGFCGMVSISYNTTVIIVLYDITNCVNVGSQFWDLQPDRLHHAINSLAKRRSCSGLVRSAKPMINSCTPAASISAKRWRIVSGLPISAAPLIRSPNALLRTSGIWACACSSVSAMEQNVVEVR